MNEQEFMKFIATKLFSTRQFENPLFARQNQSPYFICMLPRGYGKTENRKLLMKKVFEETSKIFNECNYSLESEGIMIGKIKIKGRKYYDRLSKRPRNM